MSIARHAMLAASAAVVLTGSRFLLSAIAARRLSQTEFGQFAYIIWLIDLAFLVCSLGATGAVSRYAAEYRSNPRRLAAFMRRWRRWAIGSPLVAGFAAILGVWLSGMQLDFVSVGLVVVWAAAQGRWAMQTAALIGCQRFDAILRANLLAGVVMVSGIALLPMDKFTLPLVFAVMATSGAVGALTGASYVLRLGAGVEAILSPDERRSIRRYMVNIWLTALLWSLVWSRGEFPVVRLYLGDEGVAAYAAALTLFGGAIQAVMLGASGVAPQLTSLWGEGRLQQALDTARKVMSLQLAACGVAALTLVCFGPELMGLAFGEKYRGGAGALVIFGVGLVSLTLSAQNHILQIATDARFNRNTTFLGLAVLMALAFALTPSLGVEGAALARASAMGVLAAISVFVVRRRWGISAVALANLLVTLSVSIVAGMAAFAIGDGSLGVRSSIFAVGICILATTLRYGSGVTVVADATHRVVSILFGLIARQWAAYSRREH